MKKQLANIFKLNGNPIQLTDNQQKIFDLIIARTYPRSQIIAPTQYGKSLVVALATLIRSVAGERFTILAPSEKKADIIMSYIIEHSFDDPFLVDQLELDPSESLDRLRRQRSRTNITFKSGGGVKTLSLDARNTKRNIESALGFGGKNVILDESSLIDDTLYAMVKRMLGGYDYKDQFLLEIGNPFYRNHFFRTWHSSNYHKIRIDYNDALREGRFSPEFIDEMRQEAFFDILYECNFPAEDTIDTRGYRILITLEQIESAMVSKDYDGTSELRLGIDVGGGGDYNVFVLRTPDYAWIESKNKSNDTMANVSEVQRILAEYPNLKPNHIFIDDIGIGRGVSDRLTELGLGVNGVSVGESAQDKTRFANIKAENYWNTRMWIVGGGKLQDCDEFKQLEWIKYKVNTDKVIGIEPKDDLKQRKGHSPDFAEALMLTFTPDPPEPSITWL